MPILGKETSVYPPTLFDGSSDMSGDQHRIWWAAFTKSRHEKALARDLLSLRIPFFLPLAQKENRMRGRTVKSYIPLFGGYVFLFASDDERSRSCTTNHISRVLPVPHQAHLVRDLTRLSRLIEQDVPLTVERYLVAGDLVRIKKGAMKGVEGVITRRRGRYRLLVNVDFLQKGVSIEIDDSNVEPV